MNQSTAKLQPKGILPPKPGLVKAILISFPMMLIIIIFLSHRNQPSNPSQQIAMVVTDLFLCVNFFLMIYTGKTYKYRSLFFIIASICFVISFMINLLETRGALALSTANMINGDAKMCPLVLPMLLIPAALTRTIIFPSSLFGVGGIAFMIVLWLGVSLTVGRGWCSWICFFGGMDEGFSRLCKKPKIKNIDKKWTYLPHAILLVIVLLSAITLSPFYCQWLCPFKVVTEYVAITSFLGVVKTIIFVILFIGLVIVLPILTGRRIQCGLFCPFASLQSFTNKINVFDVRINRDKCANCKLCVKSCPTFSLDEVSLSKGKTLLSCTKCGRCIDICPQNAVSYHIKGTPVNITAQSARLLFLYPAYIFGAVISGGSIAKVIQHIINLAVTGSIL